MNNNARSTTTEMHKNYWKNSQLFSHQSFNELRTFNTLDHRHAVLLYVSYVIRITNTCTSSPWYHALDRHLCGLCFEIDCKKRCDIPHKISTGFCMNGSWPYWNHKHSPHYHPVNKVNKFNHWIVKTYSFSLNKNKKDTQVTLNGTN